MKKIVYILIFLIFITSIAAVSASDDLNETVIINANDKISIYEDNLIGNDGYDGDWDDEEPYYVPYGGFELIMLENGTIIKNHPLPDYKDLKQRGNKYFTFSDAYIPNNTTVSYGLDIPLPITSSFRHYYQNGIAGGTWAETDKYTTVNIYIDENPVLSTTITNGRHTVKISRDLKIDVGIHDVKVILSKNINIHNAPYWYDEIIEKFTISSTLYSTLNVTKSNIYLNTSNTYSKENHTAPIITNVKNENGDALKDYRIDFYKNDEYIGTEVSDENGNAILNYFIPQDSTGKYNITSVLGENENHYNATSSSNLIINDDIHTKLNANDLTTYYNDGSNFTCQLSELDGTPISNETLIFEINGLNYTRTTDINGTASIIINLNPGEYELKVRLKSARYVPCNSTSKVNVKSTIIANDLTKYYHDHNQFYATFLNSKGEKLVNNEVTFNINGVEYKRNTTKGVAKLNINLPQGTYTITSSNPETGEKYSNNITVMKSTTIIAYDFTKYYKDETKFKMEINDAKFYADINKFNPPKPVFYNVTFNINGVIYEKINQSSTIKLDIDLEPGEYIMTIDYDGYKKSIKITVLSTLNTTDLEKTYGSSETFDAHLVDTKGKVYAKQNITFKVNGVSYNRTTDENGTARLNIRLLPGEYLITTSHNGLNITNRITVLSPLNATDLEKTYRSKETFNVKLVNGTGQAYANQTVTFNVNGVSYNRTTDENGIARLNINLMSGEYIITSTYDDLNIKNKITVKK